MEVTAQVGRDHPIDLKRLARPGAGPPGSMDHLATVVPVAFRGQTVKMCFVGRGDVGFLRVGARNIEPPASSVRSPARFTNLAMTLRPGDQVQIGPDLMDLRLLSVTGCRALLGLTVHSPDLLLNLEPIPETQYLDLHVLIDRLNRGEPYRSDAL